MAISSTLSPNSFDGQMLLLDMFLGNVKLNKNKLPEEPIAFHSAAQVPFFDTARLTNINQLLGTIDKGCFDFINQVKPHEYAQMHPAISLSLVNINDEKQIIPLPLSAVGEINTGLRLSEFDKTGYYSTKTFGLTALNMFLDGNDHPFFGKSYIVDFEFLFDSVNTYTSNIPGTNISYANIFRSNGRVGETQFCLKLDIGYSTANKEIKKKYKTNSDGMSFSIYLSFLKSSIDIKENLSVVIKAEYQSREGKIFDSTQLFDILGLDLAAEREKYENKLESVQLKKQALTRAVDLAEREIRKEISSNIDRLPQQISNIQAELTRAKLAEKRVSHLGVQHSQPAELKRKKIEADLEVAQQAYKESLRKKELNRDELLQELGITEGTANVMENIDNDLKKAKDKLNNVRHEKIVEAVQDLLNGTAARKTKKSVGVDVNALKEYYGDAGYSPGRLGLKAKKKNLQLAQNAPNPKPTTTAQPTATTNAVAVMASWMDGYLSGGKPSKSNPFQSEIDKLASAISREKEIEYILLGDLLRLIFRRLKKNIDVKAASNTKASKTVGANSIQTIKRNLNKSVIILPNIEFHDMEAEDAPDPKMITRSLYLLPISVAHLHYIFARELYGRNRSTITLFDLMDEITKLIAVTRKRKAQVLNRENAQLAFSLSKMTYPLYDASDEDDAVEEYAILTHHPEKNRNDPRYRYGILLNVRKNKQPSSGAGSIPRFVFGGQNRGIIINFGLTEYDDDDLQKMVLEEVSGNTGDIIPSMFSLNVKTMMCPFFQLGMIIKVEAPTLNDTARGSNIFIKGNYYINKITHSFSVNSGFTTTLGATMFTDEKQIVQSVSKKENEIDNKLDRAAIEIYGSLKSVPINRDTPAATRKVQAEIMADRVQLDLDDGILSGQGRRYRDYD